MTMGGRTRNGVQPYQLLPYMDTVPKIEQRERGREDQEWRAALSIITIYGHNS